MREILFRGKSIQGNNWVYGYFIKLLKPCIFDAKMKKDPVYAGNWIYKLSAVDPATVGQYTGLDDKNGLKIFEGDIVETRDKKCFIVEWDISGCRFIAVSISLSEPGRGNERWIVYLDSNWQQRYEVVGNIHDNPEMVEANS